MNAVTSTELQHRTSSIIDRALAEPVQITRNSRSVVVLLSVNEFERMKKIEDAYWGELASIALKSDSATNVEISDLLARL
jgi:prevent-host-death family protein